MHDIIERISKDWLERDGSTFVHKRMHDRLGWEKTLKPGQGYSAFLLDAPSQKDLLKQVYPLARNVITAMNTPFKVHVDIGGNQSYTDSRTVHVATDVFDREDIERGKQIDVFLGFTVHESSHLLYTDFSLTKELTKLPYVERMWIKDLDNIIEDEYIERTLGEQKPGLANFLEASKWYSFGNYLGKLEEVCKDQDEFVQLFNCFLGLVRYPALLTESLMMKYGTYLLRARDVLTPYPEDSAQCMEAARKIFDIFKDFLKASAAKEIMKGHPGAGEPSEDDSDEDGDSEKGDGGSDASSNDNDPEDMEKEQEDNDEAGNETDSDEDTGSDGETDGQDQESSDDMKPDGGDSGEEQPSGEEESDGASGEESHGDEDADKDSGDTGSRDEESTDGKDPEEENGDSEDDNPEPTGKDSAEGGDTGSSGEQEYPADEGFDEDDFTAEELREIEKKVQETLEDRHDTLREALECIAEELKKELDKEDKAYCIKEKEYIAEEVEGTLEQTDGLTFFRKMDDSKEKYLQSYEKIKPYISGIRKAIQMHFKDYSYALRGQKSGKLEARKLADAFMGSRTVYIRKGEVRTDKVAVCLLVDESGSMYHNNKWRSARDTAVLLNEALSGIPDVELFIYGHSADNSDLPEGNTEILVYKDHRTRCRYSLGNIEAREDNRDGTAILEVARKVRTQTSLPVLFFIISDGDPSACGYYGYPAQRDVKDKVEKVEKMGFSVVQICIDAVYDPSTMFRNFLLLTDMNTLAKDLSKTIKTALKTNTICHYQ